MGHSATGGVCRFLASSRAEMCSSSAQTRGATGWGRTLAAWRGQVSALPAAGSEASRKPALLIGSPSHSPTAGGCSAEGSGPGAVGVSQPKVERTRMRRWPELRRLLREWRRYIWDPARVHVRPNMGFGRPRPPGPSDAAIRTTPIRTWLSGSIPTRHTASAAPPCGRHPRLAEPDGFLDLDTEHDSADVSRMMDRMDVSHYRPGRLSATEEVAVDGHHHLRVDAVGPTAWCRSGPASCGSASSHGSTSRRARAFDEGVRPRDLRVSFLSLSARLARLASDARAGAA